MYICLHSSVHAFDLLISKAFASPPPSPTCELRSPPPSPTWTPIRYTHAPASPISSDPSRFALFSTISFSGSDLDPYCRSTTGSDPSCRSTKPPTDDLFPVTISSGSICYRQSPSPPVKFSDFGSVSIFSF
ncbi:hypothetical protein L2E82_05491 [Cichorium intybus]|uniref:Uncharacterized protein n=1 Tax=Cichorium intybus TaxID=13427 RepID=A0ACB9H7C2_CICIN|nr:hypothetical protein L2E82_05491 [Cichorium intybus]